MKWIDLRDRLDGRRQAPVDEPLTFEAFHLPMWVRLSLTALYLTLALFTLGLSLLLLFFVWRAASVVVVGDDLIYRTGFAKPKHWEVDTITAVQIKTTLFAPTLILTGKKRRHVLVLHRVRRGGELAAILRG